MIRDIAIWAIALLVTAGVVIRPWRLPEAIWATIGAVALVGFTLLPLGDALSAIGRGTEVYLFLAGMMLIAEIARREGLFDRLAVIAADWAGGSASRLFALVYGVGTVVTVFLSNDATAVVLTPAVYIVTRAVGAPPLPYLFVCAFIANAASFVLPISNPANLVIFGDRMPTLGRWISSFGLASCLSIAVTFAVLRWRFFDDLLEPVAERIDHRPLGPGARLAGIGTLLAICAQLLASALGLSLGWTTLVAGVLMALVVLLITRQSPVSLLRGISWSVLPLVAGLFVMVAGLESTGAVGGIATTLRAFTEQSIGWSAFGSGWIVALASNLMNNLPAGLLSAAALSAAQSPQPVSAAVLIGIDLGPNFSVTGSLATILWLLVLRREGLEVSAWRFLKIGMLVTTPALILAMGSVALLSR